MITRRRAIQSALAMALLAAGVKVGVRLPFSRADLRQLGPYSTLLENLLAHEAMGPEVAAIGRDYLTRVAGDRDVHELLQELAPLERHQIGNRAPEVLARRLRDDIHADVRDDFGKGALVVLRGYFVPESLAKFCAVAFLTLGSPD
jgi:hypothetical protein